MTLEGLSILGQSRVKAAGKAVPAINPATGSDLAPAYHWATLDDVARAAELATEAFAEYRHWPAARRAKFLRLIASFIEVEARALVERANLETALPIARLQGEIARTCGQLRLFASLIEEGWWLDARIDHANPERKPGPKPDVRSMLQALGPVAVFSSSNFPFAFSVAGGDTASALAAGCAVIVKPHQGHLGTSEMVGVLIQRAARESSAPAGIFSMVFGPGRDVGITLVKHPLVKAVGFTGSLGGGRALMDAAAARPEPIPVYAEMGSVNPVFVLPGAIAGEPGREQWAKALAAAVTGSAGQLCTKPGVVFVPDTAEGGALGDLTEQLIAGTGPGPMLTEGKAAGHRRWSEKVAASAAASAASASGEQEADSRSGKPFAVQIAAKDFTGDYREEHFGPATVIVHADPAEYPALAETLEGQLTATIIADDAADADRSAARGLLPSLVARAGRVVWNGVPTGVAVVDAMQHGGPWPATSAPWSTSVGTEAIRRFVRPV